MKWLNLPGLLGIGLGIAGFAFIIDAGAQLRSSPAAGDQPVKGFVDFSVGAQRLADDLFDLAAMADDGWQPLDLSQLLRVDEREVMIDDSVSTTVLSNGEITKIAGGVVSRVSVVTTPSGTYSTDGLQSPHVQYPGVLMSEAESRGHASTGLMWHTGLGWLPVPAVTSGSITTYTRTLSGGLAVNSGGGTCIYERTFTFCN